ncbi:MAG: hypothetical protein Q7T55_15465 [Solirubrobacteraceae bacterium]|nr:hypothetical protein [Solirubrobacteraceae bacterium]
MRRFVVPFLISLAAAFALHGVAASAAAAQTKPLPPSKVRFGIGDQHTAMFTDVRWTSMDLRITRYFIPWDAADDRAQLDRAIGFVEAARAANVEVLLHLTGRIYDGTRERTPTAAAYTREARKLIAIFRPMGVRTWGVWNEENHPTQPTFAQPTRAAQYFLAMRAACTGCTIVALDLLTQGGARSTGVASYRGYTQRFFKALGRKASYVKIIGIHNYGDLTIDGGVKISRDLITYAKRFNRKARFWITESGGIASNRGRTCSETRQANSTQRMFTHAASLAKNGVDRLYMYNWTADDCIALHDSGLIRKDGSARPALGVIEQNVGSFAR